MTVPFLGYWSDFNARTVHLIEDEADENTVCGDIAYTGKSTKMLSKVKCKACLKTDYARFLPFRPKK